MSGAGQSGDSADSSAQSPPNSSRYSTIQSSDPIHLTELVRDWNFEFSQLEPGAFNASGAVVELDGVLIGKMTTNTTLRHRGAAPPNMVAIFLPGAGSGPVYAQAQLVEPGQCMTLAPGAYLEGVTHKRYVDMAVGFDLQACNAALGLMQDDPIGSAPGTTIAAPGQAWINDMDARIDWLIATVVAEPASLTNAQVRASLSDQFLARMAYFNGMPVDVDSTTRADRASRRASVQRARDFIHGQLSEPMRLSELCRQARLKIRSLEYGFLEVTGVTPIAYIRSMRLNAARRALLRDASARRSISEIAMDTGFWHLSQFATDYRLFFGETPSETRRRGFMNGSVIKAN